MAGRAGAELDAGLSRGVLLKIVLGVLHTGQELAASFRSKDAADGLLPRETKCKIVLKEIYKRKKKKK